MSIRTKSKYILQYSLYCFKATIIIGNGSRKKSSPLETLSRQSQPQQQATPAPGATLAELHERLKELRQQQQTLRDQVRGELE